MEKYNKSIQCTVEDCKYHAGSCDHCTLNSVLIGSHNHTPLTEKETSCLSFDLK